MKTSQATPDPRRRSCPGFVRAAARAIAGALLGLLLVNGAWAQAVSSVPFDGVSFTLNANRVNTRINTADPGFVMTINDATPVAGAGYVISGIPDLPPPDAFVVMAGSPAVAISPVAGPNGNVYPITAAQIASDILITPPLQWTGDLPDLAVARTVGTNRVTDFDNGTFDYDGPPGAAANAAPTVEAGAVPIQYADRARPAELPGNTASARTYTIDISGAVQGFWLDLRSIDNPWAGPFIPVNALNAGQAGYTPLATPTAAERAASGKFFMIDAGDIGSGVLLTTTLTGLLPNTDYDVGAFVANLVPSDVGLGAIIAPELTLEVVLQDGTHVPIATPATVLPQVPGNANLATAQTAWTDFSRVINTGNNTEFTVTFLNTAAEGTGNDVAIDNITVRPIGASKLAAAASVGAALASAGAAAVPALADVALALLALGMAGLGARRVVGRRRSLG